MVLCVEWWVRRPGCPEQSKAGGREAGMKNADHLGSIGLGKDLFFLSPVTWKARGGTML